jgi:ribose 5-phosphate isomerase B
MVINISLYIIYMKKQKIQETTIYIGADHAGWELKESIETFLLEQGYNVVDMGNQNMVKEDDYPDFGHAVAKRVISDPGSRGIAICGNAQGICIVANKVRGVRAITGFNEYVAETSRTDDDSNIICLPGRILKKEEASTIVNKWLNTSFSNEDRHIRRLDKLQNIEAQEFGNN